MIRLALTDAAEEQDARYARRRHDTQPAAGSTAANVAALWTDGLRISDIARELGSPNPLSPRRGYAKGSSPACSTGAPHRAWTLPPPASSLTSRRSTTSSLHGIRTRCEADRTPLDRRTAGPPCRLRDNRSASRGESRIPRSTVPIPHDQPMPEPVVVEVVAIERLRLGANASRRAVVRWSDGSQGEALRWFDDLCRHPHKSSNAASGCRASARSGSSSEPPSRSRSTGGSTPTCSARPPGGHYRSAPTRAKATTDFAISS
jgi:hypothetical protein